MVCLLEKICGIWIALMIHIDTGGFVSGDASEAVDGCRLKFRQWFC
jgi:hypothetical protein